MTDSQKCSHSVHDLKNLSLKCTGILIFSPKSIIYI
jgi:hypothetical protein